MEHYKLYQRGNKEATVSYEQESRDVPYIVRIYTGEALVDKIRTVSKQSAAKIAMQWLNKKEHLK